MPTTTEQLQALLDRRGDVLDASGRKIGSAARYYVDDVTGEPTFVTVRTGLLNTSHAFVPLQGARAEGEALVVGYDEDTVRGAPGVDDDGGITPEEEAQLYAYYGVRREVGGADRTGVDTGAFDATAFGTSGPTTDTAMTRSEERLHVGTRVRATERVWLRKYLVSEEVTQRVTVRREEVRLEREPVPDGDVGDLLSSEAFDGRTLEVVLHEERPVVSMTVVPVERVRLVTDVVTAQTQVTEQVRHEEITTDVDGDIEVR